MVGYEASRRTRQMSGPSGKIPVVALTASGMAGVRERCLEAGMDAYLSKFLNPIASQSSGCRSPVRPAPTHIPGTRPAKVQDACWTARSSTASAGWTPTGTEAFFVR